jgi:hypothetical protein
MNKTFLCVLCASATARQLLLRCSTTYIHIGVLRCSSSCIRAVVCGELFLLSKCYPVLALNNFATHTQQN